MERILKNGTEEKEKLFVEELFSLEFSRITVFFEYVVTRNQ